jgi:citrate lyase alpha subunit
MATAPIVCTPQQSVDVFTFKVQVVVDPKRHGLYEPAIWVVL